MFQGVVYTRQARSTPRPLMIHIVEVDLAAPGVDFLVTPGDDTSSLELPARTTSAFLKEFEVQVAINGSFSRPFRAGVFLWDYYPHSGDPVDVLGLAISNGDVYSDAQEGRPVLCVSAGQAQIRASDCPTGTFQALAGERLLVKGGRSIARDVTGKLHPRTAVGVDAQGTMIWLIVVDGRQPNYSEGVTLVELAEIAVGLGAQMALNLDGGGSSTLVTAAGRGTRTLNAPIHTRIPTRQRPVANHLGVYALPVESRAD
jgi:exopolysaccharide biosynthesis protein